MIGGDRMVFWKTEEHVGDVGYGPVWIANMDGEVIEDTDLWLTYEEAEAFARSRGLPLDEVREQPPATPPTVMLPGSGPLQRRVRRPTA